MFLFGQFNRITRVLVYLSIYQGSILDPYFWAIPCACFLFFVVVFPPPPREQKSGQPLRGVALPGKPKRNPHPLWGSPWSKTDFGIPKQPLWVPAGPFLAALEAKRPILGPSRNTGPCVNQRGDRTIPGQGSMLAKTMERSSPQGLLFN